MALIPPQPIGILPGQGLWNDWIEKIRTAINSTLSSINWSIITGKPTTVAGYGITDAVTTSTTLDANRIILGNGGHDVVDMSSLGTTTTVLHGNAAGAPTFGAVVLTTDVSGILPIANGGTGVAIPTANPTASVGLSTVNGSASTYMRSDAAPPLSQSISPTMTGNWTFTPSSGNTLFSAGNVGIGVSSPLAKLHVNSNTSVATSISGALIHVSGADSSAVSIAMDGFAVAPTYIARRAQGTAGTKTAVQANQNIGVFAGQGYGSTAYSSGTRGSINFLAAENWTDSAQGTYATINVTASGSTTLAEQFRVDATYVEMKAQVRKTGVISPAQITANQDDYSPTGLSTAARLRVNSDASRDITGIQGGADGRELFITNVGSNTITLKNASASSTAGNRFATGADIVLGADVSVLIVYDGTSSRWRAA